MIIKRLKPDDPAIQGRDVVLASEAASVLDALTKARTDCQAMSAAGEQQANRILELETELASVRNLSVVLDSDASLDQRMVAAGMYSVGQILAGKPIDAFIRHAGVIDLDTFNHWLERKRAEFVKLQARFELAGRESDELYEWVMSHAATYSEVMINFRHVYPQHLQRTDGVDIPDTPKSKSDLH